MGPYQGRRDFRAGTAMVLVALCVTLLFATGAVMTFRARRWSWVSIALAVATILGAGAIIESLVVRIRLLDIELVITDLRGRRRYPVTEIAGVAEAKYRLGNSIRARLKNAGR